MTDLITVTSDVIAASGANNWLFGDLTKVLVKAAAALLIYGLLWWKAGPLITKAWKERTERISTELANAETARVDAEAALSEAQARVADLSSERERLIAEARQTAEIVREQIVARAQEEAEAIRRRAAADAEAAKAQAATDLQAQVAALALGAAEEIVRASLDEATQAALVDAYIDAVGARS